MKTIIDKISNSFLEESKYKQLMLTIIALGLSYGLYKGVIDNYLAEVVTMNEFDRGVAEFFRELPGLLIVFILAAFYLFSAELIYKIGFFLMIVGLSLHAVLPADKIWITIAICVFSLGEHIAIAMRSTLVLSYSKPGRGGEALGFHSSVYQIGTLAGFIVVIIAFLFVSGKNAFRVFFVLSTVFCVFGGYYALNLSSNSETDKTKNRFYFHKKYKKFYWLEVFYGARKQVFFTFGPYVLILFYGASTSVISLLFAISAICCTLASPLVGKIIDKVGYKIVMVSDTLILVIVCFFYGFAHHIFQKDVAFVVCCINYVLDSVISLAAMASSVYVQDISDTPEEMRATISTGLSVNHLITILIALFGGWIWQTLGIETLFVLSAILGLCNSAYAASIKTPQRDNS